MVNDIKSKIIYFLFIFYIISFLLTPRLFSGVRLDDFIILFSYIIFVFSWKEIYNLPINNPIFGYFLFLFYSLSLSFYASTKFYIEPIDNWVVLGKYITYLGSMILSYLFSYYHSDKIRFVIRLVIFCLILNSIWGFFQAVNGNYKLFWGVDEASSYGIKLIGEGAAFQVGSIIAYAICFILVFIKNKSLLKKFILWFWVAFLFYMLYLTESRISILTITLITITFLFSGSWIKKVLSVQIMFVLGIYIYNYLNFNIILMNISDRMTIEGIMASFLVRANEIWGQALLGFLDNILFGQGLGTLSAIEQTSEAHNYFLKILYEGGIIYFSIFIYFLITIIPYMKNNILKKIFKDQNERLNILFIIRGMFFIIFIAAFVQDAFASSKVIIPFLLLVGYICGRQVRVKNYE